MCIAARFLDVLLRCCHSPLDWWWNDCGLCLFSWGSTGTESESLSFSISRFVHKRIVCLFVKNLMCNSNSMQIVYRQSNGWLSFLLSFKWMFLRTKFRLWNHWPVESFHPYKSWRLGLEIYLLLLLLSLLSSFLFSCCWISLHILIRFVRFRCSSEWLYSIVFSSHFLYLLTCYDVWLWLKWTCLLPLLMLGWIFIL